MDLKFVGKKLLEHDKRFDDHDKRFDEHDKQFRAVAKKLLEHDDKFESLEKKIDSFEDKMVTRLDKIVVAIERLDQERLFQIHRLDRHEEDISKLKTKVGLKD